MVHCTLLYWRNTREKNQLVLLRRYNGVYVDRFGWRAGSGYEMCDIPKSSESRVVANLMLSYYHFYSYVKEEKRNQQKPITLPLLLRVTMLRCHYNKFKRVHRAQLKTFLVEGKKAHFTSVFESSRMQSRSKFVRIEK